MKAFFRCNCGKNRLLIKQLKAQGYEVIIVNMQPQYRTEASSYKTKLPFKVTNGLVERL